MRRTPFSLRLPPALRRRAEALKGARASYNSLTNVLLEALVRGLSALERELEAEAQ